MYLCIFSSLELQVVGVQQIYILQNRRGKKLSFLLGAVTQLRKANVSFVMSLSVRMEQLGFQWRDFREILCMNIFKKYIKKIQILFKFDWKI
jgi:hypothetical protein